MWTNILAEQKGKAAARLELGHKAQLRLMWITQSRQHIYIKFPFIISYGYHYLCRRYPIWISFIGAQFDKNVWWRIWKTLYHYILHLCYTSIPYRGCSFPINHDHLMISWSHTRFFFLKKKIRKKGNSNNPINQFILQENQHSVILFYFFFFRQPKDRTVRTQQRYDQKVMLLNDNHPIKLDFFIFNLLGAPQI